MPHDPYRALYVHIPFCKRRCLYCDFATRAVSADSAEVSGYIEDVSLKIRRLANEGELAQVETIYIGGGTPTHVGAKGLTMLMYAISTSIDLSKVSEFTVEANPESVDGNLIRDIWALGANRLSIGVQSFSDPVLETLGRVHTAKQAEDAICAAKERFDNVSIDLMCGIPGQTEGDLEDSLQRALDLKVPHVSVYPLAIEPHTPFSNMVRRGQLAEPDEDAQAAHMELARDMLESAGLERYEVASYALPGYECRHNISYWTGVPYKGVGASAATMTQNSSRRMREQDGRITDDLDAREMAAEDMMLGMRMARGVPEGKVREAAKLIPRIYDVLDSLEQAGLVRFDDGRFMPTERGWLCGNELYGALLDSAI